MNPSLISSGTLNSSFSVKLTISCGDVRLLEALVLFDNFSAASETRWTSFLSALGLLIFNALSAMSIASLLFLIFLSFLFLLTFPVLSAELVLLGFCTYSVFLVPMEFFLFCLVVTFLKQPT